MGGALLFYYIMFAISLLLPVVYAFIFHKHYDANLTIMMVLVPVVNLGFVLIGNASTIGEALIALKLTYIGGCFVLLTSMFLIFKMCGVNLSAWLRTLLVLISVGVFVTTLTIGYNDLFYVGTPTLAHAYGAAYITKLRDSFFRNAKGRFLLHLLRPKIRIARKYIYLFSAS